MLALIELLSKITKNEYSAMTVALFSIAAISYVHWIENPATLLRVTGVEKNVQSIRETQLETKLDETFLSLCKNPGDPALLERIRELQQKYIEVTGGRYPQPSCELLAKIAK